MEDKFILQGDVRVIVYKHDDGLLLADFTLVGIDIDVNMYENAGRAINGQVNAWKFDHGVINTPTTLLMTARDIEIASGEFNNVANNLQNKMNSNWKIKSLFNGVIMTNFFDLKLDGASKTIVIGFDIDPIFVGLPNQYQ